MEGAELSPLRLRGSRLEGTDEATVSGVGSDDHATYICHIELESDVSVTRDVGLFSLLCTVVCMY